MVYVPTNNWYMTENIQDCEIYMPKRTFIISGTCMICMRVEGVRTHVIRTMYPRYEYKVCNSEECARKLKKGYAAFLRSNELIMVENDNLKDNCNVTRSSGAVDNDWSVTGFVSGEEGVTRVMMSKYDITKTVPYEKFAESNSTLAPILNSEIEEFFASCLSMVKNIVHDAV